jgi:hypothetical protein
MVMKQEHVDALNALANEFHGYAREKGFYENFDPTDRTRAAADIALVHSELSEALDEVRNQGLAMTDIYYLRPRLTAAAPPAKPEGVPVEMVDALIRILDFCGARGIDIGNAVRVKIAYNAKRPHKHGRAL